MRGVADDHHATLVPGRRQDDVLHGPVDDGRVVDDQVLVLRDRPAELPEPLAHLCRKTLDGEPDRFARRRLLDHQHVHQVRSERDEARRAGGADVDPDVLEPAIRGRL